MTVDTNWEKINHKEGMFPVIKIEDCNITLSCAAHDRFSWGQKRFTPNHLGTVRYKYNWACIKKYSRVWRKYILLQKNSIVDKIESDNFLRPYNYIVRNVYGFLWLSKMDLHKHTNYKVIVSIWLFKLVLFSQTENKN